VDAHDRGDNRLAALYAAEAYYGAKDAGTAAGEIDYGRAAQSAAGHAKTAAADPNTANGSAALVKVTVSIGSSHQSSNSSCVAWNLGLKAHPLMARSACGPAYNPGADGRDLSE
jgi:hypothetical protein